MHHYAIYVQNISLKGYQWYLMRYIINNLIQYKYLGVSENVINIPKINQNYCCYVKNYQPKDFFMSKFTYFQTNPFLLHPIGSFFLWGNLLLWWLGMKQSELNAAAVKGPKVQRSIASIAGIPCLDSQADFVSCKKGQVLMWTFDNVCLNVLFMDLCGSCFSKMFFVHLPGDHSIVYLSAATSTYLPGGTTWSLWDRWWPSESALEIFEQP